MFNRVGVLSSSSTSAVMFRGGPGVSPTRLVKVPGGSREASGSAGRSPSYLKNVMGRDLPSSWIAKSSGRRSVIGWPFLSRAVTVSSTSRVVERNVGVCSCAANANNAATTITASIRRLYHCRSGPLASLLVLSNRPERDLADGPAQRFGDRRSLRDMDGQTLRQLFSLANAFKEGDMTVGGTTDAGVREDARRMLLSTTAGDIRRTVLVEDGVTAALERSRDRRLDDALDPLTIARLKAVLLGPGAAAWARTHRDALASEGISALVKVMSNDELSSAACALFNPLDGDGVAIGSPRHFGSRIQPNSPGDDE